ncbi:unnamed protein product [Medioppia subpectinata]|uniref:Acireductone dioxygenase n=1 Tax=Medioppia subpectinata TaxID=1979941 RepID=A0A7R9Q868_9ACAR|nr:unnamed protein product [Medioppia subpectinata]CAG2116568.1 unnamed protein product [Medioppia subpectinata]
MVKAWYINDESVVNVEMVKRSERHLNPPQYVTLDELKRKIGVQTEWINVNKYKTVENLQKLSVQKGYNYWDIIDIENHVEKHASFYTEHMHNEPEVRLVLDGSGYFDVRDAEDKWIRVLVEKGDLLSFMAGGYHRLTLDSNNHLKLFRLFGSEPDWTSLNRPQDDHPVRIAYALQALNGF